MWDDKSNVKVNNIEKFAKICRTCLSDEFLSPISESSLPNGVSVSQVLSKFIVAEDLHDEQLPQKICTICIDQLTLYVNFQITCEQNELLFKSLLQGPITKTETDQNSSIEDNAVPLSTPKKALRKARHKPLKPLYQAIEDNLKESTSGEEKSYTCKQCGKTFRFKYQLVMHARVHTKEKPFKCDKCDLRFSLKGNLRRHKMIHTGERPHRCPKCEKAFIQAISLRLHINKHHKDGASSGFSCQICGRLFVRLKPYQRHVIKLHSNKTESPSMDTPKLEFKCPLCEREFSKLILLKKHEAKHGEKTFLCSDCGRGFVRKADLQSHVKIHTGEKPHQCSICNKSFAHAGTLINHSLMHSGFKLFHCDTCSKSFSQSSHLKVHQRVHSGERPYSCTYCGKTFAQKSNLTVHIRTHTGEAPYICTVCGKGFYDSNSMKKHKSIHFRSSLASVKDEAPHYPENAPE